MADVLSGMQFHALTIGSVIDHAAAVHGDRPISTALDRGAAQRTSWRELRANATSLAAGLCRNGVGRGDVAATLCSNRNEHLGLFYAVPGIGAVLCPVNPRLPPDQIRHILQDCGACVLFVESHYLKTIVQIERELPGLRLVIVIGEGSSGSPLDKATIGFEALCVDSAGFSWTLVEETAPATLAYTSGTTGPPKGVAYTHRAIVLHAMAICQPDAFGLDACSCFLLMVPLYHANAWCIPFAAPMVGAGIVMPGPSMDPRTLLELILAEQVTHTGAVPTVVQDLVEQGRTLSPAARSHLVLRRMFSGGSAVPLHLFDDVHQVLGAQLQQGWGMTETNSSGVHAMVNARLSGEAGTTYFRSLQGRPPYGMELKLSTDDGENLPWNGEQAGRLRVRGHWVIARYHGRSESVLDGEGYFDTGDIASIDRDGFVRILDRDKDLIKSGGEWISSLELERAALTHPGVRQAAAIAIPHPRWQERPALFCVLADGIESLDPDSVLDAMLASLLRWQLPDRILFIEALPLTSTGKVDKRRLRELYAEQAAGLA